MNLDFTLGNGPSRCAVGSLAWPKKHNQEVSVAGDASTVRMRKSSSDLSQSPIS